MQRLEMERRWAVDRYKSGEDVDSICASLGKSARWLYKWIDRAASGGEWWQERSRRPENLRDKTSETIEELIVAARQELVREGAFSGAQSIVWELQEKNIAAPSTATVNRILRTRGCFEREPTSYQSKGHKYPTPETRQPNDVQQSDFVGPRYIDGGVRFYSLNTADVITARAATIPIKARAADSVIPAVWETWGRLGLPKIYQVDNELVFWGSRLHPRGMSQMMRLCLHNGVEPLFIPPAEPWRNGVVEKFNDHWQQKFLARIRLTGFEALQDAAREFEGKINSKWRYSKTGGVCPNEALRRTNVVLRFPATADCPKMPISKPTSGRYHLIRFIRSDRVLDIFGERFKLPSAATYEYVTATIDVTDQQLTVVIDGKPITTFDYKLR